MHYWNNDITTEQFDGEENPNVIRRAPFEIYEIMEPVAHNIVPDESVTALRFEIPIPADASIGTQTVTLTLQQNGNITKCEYQLNIFSAQVPDSGKNSLSYTNWFNIKKMEIGRAHV